MSEAAFELREGTAKTYLNARLDARAAARAADVLGATLPQTPNRYERGKLATAYWIGPGEWLLAAPHRDELALEERLRGEIAPDHGALVDVSGAYALFELGGKKAEELLRKSSPYDFHPIRFAPPRCAQTVFAKTNALISVQPGGWYELIVRSSYAHYVRTWIAAVTTEYG